MQPPAARGARRALRASAVSASTQPFMRCDQCQRVGATWGVENEAYVCICGGDESGMVVVNPQSLIGSWWITTRNNRVKLIEWYGGNTFRAMDEYEVTRTVSILCLNPDSRVAPPAG
jgi:hypothetical protein